MPQCAGWTAHGTFGSSLTAYFIADRQLTPKIRTLVDFLVERFGKSPAWDRGIHVGGAAKAR
jgi:Na+/proline symporter